MTTLDVDPYLPNAYSKTLNKDGTPSGCRFDLTSYQAHLDSQEEPGKKLVAPEIIADELLLKKNDRKSWELDVRGQVSTKKWLSNYGLKKNKLDIKSLMQAVGFKKRDDFDYTLRKPIPSKYTVGKGFCEKYTPNDGKITNVAISKDRMIQYATRLKQAISLFRKRMDWLTSESRRIFGVIQESVVIIILDVKTMSPQQFDQYRCAVERVLKEQVSTTAKFNIYRTAEDFQCFKDECIAVSQPAIEEAVDWLWTLERTRPVGQASCCEAVIKALEDPQAQGVYLFTMGNSAEAALELMLSSCREAKKPLHVVSYNCDAPEVMKSLKDLSDLTGGRFHAYGVIMEMDSFDPLPLSDDSNRAHVAVRKRTIGGVPAGAGVRPDVLRLFEEIEEAQSTLAQMETVISTMPNSKLTIYKKKELSANNMSRHVDRAEEYMGSSDWLNTNGLKVKRLTFYDLLGKVAFKHCDGVVNLKRAPGPDEHRTDANSQDILVNARYCDQFAHVKWKDGTIVHVQVTPETHRVYEQKVNNVMENINTRITWLQQGSRQLFGTIIERRLYLIIDTSASMAPSLQFVKDKTFLLLQEQIRHKDAFNIISFGSKVTPWRDRLVEVTEENLKLAWMWIRNLDTNGSTNTLGALKYALADINTEGIYMLTDGRPDHPPKSVLAQVTLQKTVPIHTISFNCADGEANKFLCQLAKDTKGRYHYFSEHGEDIEGPEPYQSEDIRLLMEEYKLAEHYLKKVSSLRDECQELQWKRSANAKLHRARTTLGTGLSRPKSAVVSLRSSTNNMPSRPQSARPTLPTSQSAPVLHTSHHIDPSKTSSYIRLNKPRKKPKVAAHTRTSLLRTLSAGSDWVLPETKSMLTKQFKLPDTTSPTAENNASPRSKTPKKKKPRFLATKNWLLRNGLRAKKLLLLDALSEAIEKDRGSAKIDNEVVSRLLDEELSPRGEKKRDSLLSNPYLEDCLLEYEMKLKSAVELYKNRLDRLIWQSLSKDEKETYRGEEEDSDEVRMRSYQEFKAKLTQSLDNCGWPVSQVDVNLMEEEIQQAETYLEQSENIREASAKCEKREITPSLDEPLQFKQPKPKPQAPDQLRGQRVVARKIEDGLYYSGLVLRSKGAHHAVVKFDSGEEETISKQFVIPTKGAISVPTLTMGDYVLVLVKGPKNQPCYVPGQVELTPKESPEDKSKFFEITVYSGNRVSALRNSIVKIGKARYNFSITYIKERNEEADNEYSDEDADEEDGDVLKAALEKYGSNLEELCYRVLNKQKEYKSRQKRLHKQMRRIREEYKEMKNRKGEQRAGIKFNVASSIEDGEEVLARWLDEGWYYRCQVQRRVSERTYMLQDSCGDLQHTSRDDIITDNDDITSKIEEQSAVIALHPNYYCSYAPAKVEEVFDDYSCSVKFYDDTRSIIEREDVFITDLDTYERDVAYIQKCEEELVGQAVVARDNQSGNYNLGTIVDKHPNRQYTVEFTDGRKAKQSCIHIFGVFSKQYKFNIGDHCLSLADKKLLVYMPGIVTGKSKTGIDVTFIDGSKQKNIPRLKSFWVSHSYYEAADTYFNNRVSESAASSARSAVSRSPSTTSVDSRDSL